MPSSAHLSSQCQGTHCTGKTGKTGKIAQRIPCQGKHREFENCQNTGKTQGIWFAQVVKSLILKVKDILKIGAKISQKNLCLKSLPIQFCVCNSHKSRKLAQGKFAVGQGKHREFENTI